MKFVNIKICPVCGGNVFNDKFTCKDNYVTGENFNLCECEKCGFIFTKKFPDSEFIGRYYETDNYISHSDTKKGAVNKLYHLARQYMLRKKTKITITESGKRNGVIVDVGCGTGYFLNAIKSKGWEVCGVEKNVEVRESAMKKFEIRIFSEKDFLNFDNEIFDVVTLWHVLEHLENISDIFENISRVLKPNGVCIIAVPNCVSYDAKKYKNNWAAYDVPRHLWHFSPNTFEMIASKHNFKIKRKKTMPLDAFYISLMSEKYKGNKGIKMFIRAIFVGVVGFFKSLVKKSESSSIIYVLTRN